MTFRNISILRSDDHLVNWSRTILTFMVEGHLSNNPLKFEGNLPRGIGGVGI